jgi:hypothetical protein
MLSGGKVPGKMMKKCNRLINVNYIGAIGCMSLIHLFCRMQMLSASMKNRRDIHLLNVKQDRDELSFIVNPVKVL